MYSAPDLPRASAGASGDGANGGPQPIAQLAAALIELAEAQRATDQKLGQLVAISQAEAAAQQSRAEHAAVVEAQPQPVAVIDINMSFGSMVVFMVKWAIAAVPAVVILGILMFFVTIFFGGTLATLLR